jgi:pilus assembly protein CpaC
VQLKEYLEKAEIKYVDMTSLAGIQQVLLQVRVAEVSRSAVRALGINAMQRNSDWFWATRPGTDAGGALVSSAGFAPLGAQSALSKLDFGTADSFTLPSSLTAVIGIPRADLEVFIQALAENQYLRILANPTLVALSGEEASFLAGGEFPIPVVQSATGGAGGTSITIDYKEFGVRLKFRPTVLGDGTIRLYTAPEVSELTSVGSLTLSGFQIPALTTRKAETTIELKSGQTFAMAGLMRSKINAINSRFPGLGDLPIIGPLFSSTRYAKDETEMVVMVTAVLVEPMNNAQTPPLPGFLHKEPSDWEFYLGGRIEGKEPARINSADAEWLKQMGLDKLMGPGAWDSYGNSSAPSQAEMAPAAVNSEQQGYLEKQGDSQGMTL